MLNSESQQFEFEDISRHLDCYFQVENREMVTKGFIPTGIRKNLLVYVRSSDHLPAHFHIESEQRSYNQKFTIKDLENISKDKDGRYDNYVKKFFLENGNFLDKILLEFIRLNPNLNL